MNGEDRTIMKMFVYERDGWMEEQLAPQDEQEATDIREEE